MSKHGSNLAPESDDTGSTETQHESATEFKSLAAPVGPHPNYGGGDGDGDGGDGDGDGDGGGGYGGGGYTGGGYTGGGYTGGGYTGGGYTGGYLSGGYVAENSTIAGYGYNLSQIFGQDPSENTINQVGANYGLTVSTNQDAISNAQEQISFTQNNLGEQSLVVEGSERTIAISYGNINVDPTTGNYHITNGAAAFVNADGTAAGQVHVSDGATLNINKNTGGIQLTGLK